MDYHVFKKPKIKNGKKICKWYYYYTRFDLRCFSFGAAPENGRLRVFHF